MTEPRTVGDVFRMFFPGYPGCIGSDNGTACPMRMGLVAAGLLAPMDSEDGDALILPLASGPVVVGQEAWENALFAALNPRAADHDDWLGDILAALFPDGMLVADEVVELGKASDDFDEFGNYGGLKPGDTIWIKRRKEANG